MNEVQLYVLPWKKFWAPAVDEESKLQNKYAVLLLNKVKPYMYLYMYEHLFKLSGMTHTRLSTKSRGRLAQMIVKGMFILSYANFPLDLQFDWELD